MNKGDALLYANGRITPAGEATAPALEHGLLYGDGLFETMRALQGRPKDWEKHWERLLAGTAMLGLAIPWPAEEVLAKTESVLNALGEEKAALRLTVTHGPGATWQAAGPPGLYLLARPWHPVTPESLERGMTATTASFPRHSRSPLVGLKSLNYLENLLGRREALARGAEEALFLNERGEVAEASMANLFLVQAGVLLTPPPAAGLLPGITRAQVLELAQAAGIPAREETITPTMLGQAEECFLTGSLTGLVPLVSLDGRPIAGGRPGPLTLRLIEKFEARS